jgi:PEP-CTERM motif
MERKHPLNGINWRPLLDPPASRVRLSLACESFESNGYSVFSRPALGNHFELPRPPHRDPCLGAHGQWRELSLELQRLHFLDFAIRGFFQHLRVPGYVDGSVSAPSGFFTPEPATWLLTLLGLGIAAKLWSFKASSSR